MIKTVGLLTRKEGLSHEGFVKHWLEVHAPLAHAVPGVRRYVQSHIVEERTRPDIPSTEVAIDGIAELWYDDRAAMERANASPEARRGSHFMRWASEPKAKIGYMTSAP